MMKGHVVGLGNRDVIIYIYKVSPLMSKEHAYRFVEMVNAVYRSALDDRLLYGGRSSLYDRQTPRAYPSFETTPLHHEAKGFACHYARPSSNHPLGVGLDLGLGHHHDDSPYDLG